MDELRSSNSFNCDRGDPLRPLVLRTLTSEGIPPIPGADLNPYTGLQLAVLVEWTDAVSIASLPRMAELILP